MKKLLVILFFIFSTQFLLAQYKGTLSGKVVDKATNETLPSVNVIIKGTYYGAATDFDGKFTITNITPGSYTVEITLLGYKQVQTPELKSIRMKQLT